MSCSICMLPNVKVTGAQEDPAQRRDAIGRPR
jgi:hypothetical protein